MADKLVKSMKGFFKSDKEDQKQVQRGVLTNSKEEKEELITWLKTSEFPLLNKRGQEAFFRFLRGSSYSEDKDIVEVDLKADGMDNNDARRYQFWLKCQGLEIGNLFKVYVDDDETSLPDAKVCHTMYKSKGGTQNMTQFVQEKVSDGEKVDGFINDLKDTMKPDLDQVFLKFKVFLENKYGKNGEHI
ncbi:uncharacterized protein LOC121865450 isoform X2 [Homarus americanus]|uniref:uncharacterized protein LOC121865450 isoform X2 n=1 Tax=Homarus americanus TaxID=6706 RepID=UPI001C45E76C|nr:uncharacterized protein LOC121865450 isoform X2 [Homarus americanus]